MRAKRLSLVASPLKCGLVNEEYNPGAAIEDDYDGLLDWADTHATSIYRPVGTCKIDGDKMEVVDSRLRARGLWVADYRR